MWSLFHISKYWGASLLSSTGESVQFQNPKLNPTQYMGANGPFFIRFFIGIMRITQMKVIHSLNVFSMWRTTCSHLGWMGRVVSWEPSVRCMSRPSLDTASLASSSTSSSRNIETNQIYLILWPFAYYPQPKSIIIPEQDGGVHQRGGDGEGGGRVLQVWARLLQVSLQDEQILGGGKPEAGERSIRDEQSHPWAVGRLPQSSW